MVQMDDFAKTSRNVLKERFSWLPIFLAFRTSVTTMIWL